MTGSSPSRTVTTVAVGFLALDAVLLAIAWTELRRPALLIGAVACALGAVAVMLSWRHYRSRFQRDKDAETIARRAAKREIEEIRELLRRGNLHN